MRLFLGFFLNSSFGIDPDSVGDLGSAMINDYTRGGVISVAKHFPGYGNLSLDPHTNQATLIIDDKELELNLIPFRKIIANHPAVAVMTAHIVIPNITERPHFRLNLETPAQ